MAIKSVGIDGCVQGGGRLAAALLVLLPFPLALHLFPVLGSVLWSVGRMRRRVNTFVQLPIFRCRRRRCCCNWWAVLLVCLSVCLSVCPCVVWEACCPRAAVALWCCWECVCVSWNGLATLQYSFEGIIDIDEQCCRVVAMSACTERNLQHICSHL